MGMELVAFQVSPWMWVALVVLGLVFSGGLILLAELRLRGSIAAIAGSVAVTVGIGFLGLAILGSRYDEGQFIAQAGEVYGITLSEESAEVMLEGTSPDSEETTGTFGAAVGVLADGRQVFAQLVQRDGEWLLVNEVGTPLAGAGEGWS